MENEQYLVAKVFFSSEHFIFSCHAFCVTTTVSSVWLIRAVYRLFPELKHFVETWYGGASEVKNHLRLGIETLQNRTKSTSNILVLNQAFIISILEVFSPCCLPHLTSRHHLKRVILAAAVYFRTRRRGELDTYHAAVSLQQRSACTMEDSSRCLLVPFMVVNVRCYSHQRSVEMLKYHGDPRQSVNCPCQT